MKNIKLLIFLFIQISLCTIVMGQSTTSIDLNGRTIQVPVANPVANTSTINESQQIEHEIVEHTVNPIQDNDHLNTVDVLNQGSDQDIPWSTPVESDESFFDTNEEIMEQIKALQARLDAVQLENQQLLSENATIRKGMQNCCIESGSLGVTNSFLLQNAPNPFSEITEIQYFLPKESEKAQIDIYEINGRLISSHQLATEGLGKLTIDGNTLSQGSYIYTLNINGRLVDSKVMMLTK